MVLAVSNYSVVLKAALVGSSQLQVSLVVICILQTTSLGCFPCGGKHLCLRIIMLDIVHFSLAFLVFLRSQFSFSFYAKHNVLLSALMKHFKIVNKQPHSICFTVYKLTADCEEGIKYKIACVLKYAKL